MRYETTMTVKGQITVPKDVRDALGLKPGQRVGIELDANGDAKLVKVDAEAKKAQWLNRLREAQAKYKPLADFMGMDGLTYQRWIRGEGPEV
jgi:AbrB family looped-hinge helix DNA binding protein